MSARQRPYVVGPFTYVKLESLPASPELDIFNKGVKRHTLRMISKATGKRTQNKKAIKMLNQGNCLRLANSEYCYRAEDHGYVKNPQQRELYDLNHNYFEGISDNTTPREITNYSDYLVHYANKNREIYKLRTGHELFVPTELTQRIIGQLINPPREEENTEISDIISAAAGGINEGGYRRKKTRIRRKRKKRRRRKTFKRNRRRHRKRKTNL